MSVWVVRGGSGGIHEHLELLSVERIGVLKLEDSIY